MSTSTTIEEWLARVDLSRLAATFRDNGIDLDVVARLGDDDLARTRPHDRRQEARARRRFVFRCRPSAGGGRRAPAAHGDVLRSRRFDGAVVTPRSRGHARRDPRLPNGLRRCHRAPRRLRRQVHGRRAARLFRLSARPRGRSRARGARRPGDRGLRRRPADAGARGAAGAHRHRHRTCRRGRPDRRGCGRGAVGGRRDAQPCRAPAGARPAQRRPHRRGHAPPGRQPVRVHRPRPAGDEGARHAAAGLAGAGRERRRQPLQGAALERHAAGRTRGGDRGADARLDERQDRPRPRRADLGRSRPRQVAPGRSGARAHRRRATCHRALFLLAASSRKRVLPDRPPARTRGGLRLQRRCPDTAAQARGHAGRRPRRGGVVVVRRPAVGARPRGAMGSGADAGEPQGEDARRAGAAVRGPHAAPAGAGDVRGSSLDGSELRRAAGSMSSRASTKCRAC